MKMNLRLTLALMLSVCLIMAAFVGCAQNPDATNDNVPLTVTAAERLTAVVNIAGFLEQNMIIGKIASIDVDNLMDIKLWYGNQYQILLGNTEQLGVKIASMKAALAQVSYDEGILDIRDPNNILIREFK